MSDMHGQTFSLFPSFFSVPKFYPHPEEKPTDTPKGEQY